MLHLRSDWRHSLSYLTMQRSMSVYMSNISYRTLVHLGYKGNKMTLLPEWPFGVTTGPHNSDIMSGFWPTGPLTTGYTDLIGYAAFYERIHVKSFIPDVSPPLASAIRQCAHIGSYSCTWTMHALPSPLTTIGVDPDHCWPSNCVAIWSCTKPVYVHESDDTTIVYDIFIL
jgi:hypothetical protein